MRKHLPFRRLLTAACLLCLCLLTGAPAAHADDTLNVGILQYYPPFSMQDAEGRMTGFDVDIAQALCRQMGRRCRLTPLPLNTIVDKLTDLSLDMAVAGLGISEERQRIMLFSEPYYHSRSRYVGKAGQSLSREALQGGKLAALYNSVQYQLLQDRWKDNAKILGFESLQSLLDALVLGRVDVLFMDEITANQFLESADGAGFAVLDADTPPQEAVEPACVAVNRRSSTLVNEINAGIAALRTSGEYERLMRKYFPSPSD